MRADEELPILVARFDALTRSLGKANRNKRGLRWRENRIHERDTIRQRIERLENCPPVVLGLSLYQEEESGR